MFAYFVRVLILRATLDNELVDSFAWLLRACCSLGLLVIPQESLVVRYEFFFGVQTDLVIGIYCTDHLWVLL